MRQSHKALLLAFAAALTQVYGNVAQRLPFLSIDGNSTTAEQNMTLSEHQTDAKDETSTSHSSFSDTFFIIITIGFMIILGLVFLWVVRRTSRKHSSLSDCDVTEAPGNSQSGMKRTTFAVSETNHSRFDETDLRESVVPVLDDNTSKYKIPEARQQEMKVSWTEADTATNSHNVAALSNHQSSRPAAPMLTNAPAQRRKSDDSQAPPSDNSSHTDDYSIDILESPASTEYSFSSESDDFFPSACWDVDSYRSASSTFLSTTSSDVFGSNHGRNSGVWKQVYGSNNTPPVGLGQLPLSSGVLFVRNIDPAAMRRTRRDTRVYGARSNNRMRLDIEL